MIDTTICPECGKPADVQWRAVLESTDGPIEHARVFCVGGHWFLLPVAELDHAVQPHTVSPAGHVSPNVTGSQHG